MQLSSLNLAASSDDILCSFLCTASNTRIVDKLVSITMSNWKINQQTLKFNTFLTRSKIQLCKCSKFNLRS